MVAEVEYQDYRNWVSTVLLDYQFIEEALRFYLDTSYRLIKKRLNGEIPFTYSYDDHEKDALGTLISKFEKVNGNIELIQELKSLVKSRNSVAHRAFLLTSEEHNDSERLVGMRKELEVLRARTNTCVYKIFEEVKSVQGKVSGN